MNRTLDELISGTSKIALVPLRTKSINKRLVAWVALFPMLLLLLVLAGVKVNAWGVKDKRADASAKPTGDVRKVSSVKPAPPSGSTIIYNSIPAPLPPNVPSLGFQSDHTNEFGDLIHFAGSARSLTQVTVVMSDFALASDYPDFPGASGPTWNHPITLNLYNVDNSGPNPAPGTVITTKTQTFAIPWRPPADPTCSSDPHGPWKASDGNCYNGIAFTVTFDLTGTNVPNDIIYGVAYNTETFGYMPIGSPGPYISLNLGLAQVPPTVGNNPFPDTAYYNTEKASNYADGGAGGTGTFRRDTNWSPFSVAATFEATGCMITCPNDITQPNDTDQCGAAVTFPDPTTSNCTSSSVSCSPGSGTFFPVGTTTVTCVNTPPPPLGPIKTPPHATTCNPQTVTESTTQTITPNNSYTCSDGVSYWRAFDLTNSFGITNTFDVQSIDIGIESATSGTPAKPASKAVKVTSSGKAGKVIAQGSGQQVTVRLYTDSGGFPASPRTQIATGDFTIADQSLTIVNLPITTTVPAGSELVVEVFAPNASGGAGNLFIFGSNTDPETAPSYVSAPNCEISDPTPTSDPSVNPDMHDMHFVMNVNGCEEIASCSFTVTVQDTQNPTLTCPANQVQCNDPDQCGAVVNYPAPTVNDNCPGGSSTCSPPSGSFFPVGTTTVTCNGMDAAGNPAPPCSFTVTVNDCQPPTINCLPAVNGAGGASCPIATSVPASFTVTATDNCPGTVNIVCTNQGGQVVTPGQSLPVGSTTITCTATDVAGNPSMCTFTVTEFSFCLQDDSLSGNVVLVNAQTGEYFFCCNGVPLASGVGTLVTHGCIGSIDHIKGDRKVHIQWDTSANNNTGAGTAFVQKSTSGKVICQITDKNMSNNNCQCSSPPPGAPTKPPKQKAQ